MADNTITNTNTTNTTMTGSGTGTGTDQQTCINCGMPKAEWRGNNGQGFVMADKIYCCQGCATGTGCTCD
jgi:hypothetical protein